jgi:adenylate kinase family enzyme
VPSSVRRDPLDEQVEECIDVEPHADVCVRRPVGALPEVDDGAPPAQLRLELDRDVSVSRLDESRTEGVCDRCGGELYRRPDDEPDTVRNRLFVYYKQTSPLIGYYFAHHLLKPHDGDRPIDEVQRDLLGIIRGVEGPARSR